MDLEKMRAFGLGNKTAFFKLTFYTYHQGAIREAKILKVVSECTKSTRGFCNTYPCKTDDVNWDTRFVFKMAGVEGTFKNDKIYLDPLRDKCITANYVSMLAITDWLGKPQLLNDNQKYHLGSDFFKYNTIVKEAYVTRHGFIYKVVATPDDIEVNVMVGGGGLDMGLFERFDNPAWETKIIRQSDNESIRYFTKTKEDIKAELAPKIVRFSDEEKRAEEEKIGNIIGNLYASIQSAVKDYAQGYPVSVTIKVNGQTANV